MRYVAYSIAIVVLVFTLNVILVAVGAPAWAHPLAWAAWLGDRLVDFGGWCGTQWGRLYAWGAQVLTDCLERLVPALRTSINDLMVFVSSPLRAVAEFFGDLWTTLCNSHYVGALKGYFVSPVVIFLVSLLALAAVCALWYYYRQQKIASTPPVGGETHEEPTNPAPPVNTTTPKRNPPRGVHAQ
jgi:hypothetical protein